MRTAPARDTPIASPPSHPWDRLSTETPKSYAAFLAYVALGARRSVREAARQYRVNTRSTSRTKTTINTWLGWSAKYKWVSRSLAREEWIARVSDEQNLANITACKLALTTRCHDFLTSTDSEIFLRGARAFTLQHPPVQRVEDVSERIEDLSDLSDAQLEKMEAVRDAARLENAKGKDKLPNDHQRSVDRIVLPHVHEQAAARKA